MAELESMTPIFESYKEEVGQLLLKIQTSRTIDSNAFEKIRLLGDSIANELAGRPLVPKQVLHEMRSAIKILRSEAAYTPDGGSKMNEMADQIEMNFDLILIGETQSDRKPGVPRII